MSDFKLYFLFFYIYSFLGWLIETIICSITKKKIVSRGFLIGPICLIYGFASLLMIIFLNKYTESPIILFVMATFICNVLEYLVSFVMEKIFNTRWWDYSNKPFNINGRICLTNSFFFGILSIVVLYYVNPFLVSSISKIPTNILNIIFWVLFISVIGDFIVSFTIIYKFTKSAKLIKKDSCDEINKKVKEEIDKNKYVLRKRLVNAFPDFKILSKIKNNIKK